MGAIPITMVILIIILTHAAQGQHRQLADRGCRLSCGTPSAGLHDHRPTLFTCFLCGAGQQH
jgi:hypothetical protein